MEESKPLSLSLSYGLASDLPAAASHAVVSLCWRLKMAPYMAASKPGKSYVGLEACEHWFKELQQHEYDR